MGYSQPQEQEQMNKIDEVVFEQVHMIHRSRSVDILNYTAMVKAAWEFDCPDLIDWLGSHTLAEFGKLIMVGFNNWLYRRGGM